MKNVNVMVMAHNATKAHLCTLGADAVRSYSEVFQSWLKHAHKVAKEVAKRDARFIIARPMPNGEQQLIDIRTLPVFSIAVDRVKGAVQSWRIRGTVTTASNTYNKSSIGFHESPLQDELNYMYNASAEHIELCLFMEIDGHFYRLVK